MRVVLGVLLSVNSVQRPFSRHSQEDILMAEAGRQRVLDDVKCREICALMSAGYHLSVRLSMWGVRCGPFAAR